MAVLDGGAKVNANGGNVVASPPPSVVENGKEEESVATARLIGGLGHREKSGEEVTLFDVFNRLIESIFAPSPNQNQDSTTTATTRTPMVDRIKESVSETAPLFREAVHNTRRDVLLWTRRGTPLRALLVISVGTVVLLALTGILVFMMFFVAATVNAIVISLLISFAAVGGFLAIFFSCLTAIYIGALVIAAFVTFTITISSIIVALVAAGWIGFFCMVWLAVTKSASVAKRSLTMAGLSFPANMGGQRAHFYREPGDVSS